MTETLAKIEKQGQEAKEAAAAAETITEDDDDIDDEDIAAISDADIDAIANQSGINPNSDTYDDGYGGMDDDDEEGEEWKKGG